MDIDFIKSGGAEDQMEMMLMMQMDEKLPDFSIPFMDHFTTQHGGNHVNSPIPADDHIHATENAAFMTTILNHHTPSNTISFSGSPPPTPYLHPSPPGGGDDGTTCRNSMATMREMIFRIAAMQPIHIDPESVKPPKRRNVKISTDPQSVAARHRREKISERIRILQRLVPGGTKMDTASMLDEAIHYVKFLKNQVQSLERVAANRPPPPPGIGFPVPISSGSYFSVAAKGYLPSAH